MFSSLLYFQNSLIFIFLFKETKQLPHILIFTIPISLQPDVVLIFNTKSTLKTGCKDIDVDLWMTLNFGAMFSLKTIILVTIHVNLETSSIHL